MTLSDPPAEPVVAARTRGRRAEQGRLSWVREQAISAGDADSGPASDSAKPVTPSALEVAACTPQRGFARVPRRAPPSGATPQPFSAAAWNPAHLTDDRPRQNAARAGPMLPSSLHPALLACPGPTGRDQDAASVSTAPHTSAEFLTTRWQLATEHPVLSAP